MFLFLILASVSWIPALQRDIDHAQTAHAARGNRRNSIAHVRADERSAGSLVHELEETVVGYDTVSHLSKAVEVHHGKTQYALMPVWLLNTKWQGKDFLFAMNGQTGKLIGDLPVDKGKFWGLFAAIAAPLAIISSVIWILL